MVRAWPLSKRPPATGSRPHPRWHSLAFPTATPVGTRHHPEHLLIEEKSDNRNHPGAHLSLRHRHHSSHWLRCEKRQVSSVARVSGVLGNEARPEWVLNGVRPEWGQGQAGMGSAYNSVPEERYCRRPHFHPTISTLSFFRLFNRGNVKTTRAMKRRHWIFSILRKQMTFFLKR